MLAILLLHVVVAAVVALLARPVGPRVFLVAAVAPIGSLTWLGTRAGAVIGGEPLTERLRWLPQLGLDLTLRLDGFSLVMATLITGAGLAVFTYSASYFAPAAPGAEPRRDLHRIGGLLVLFAGAMLGVVLADNLLAIYAFWELTSITSFALVGIDDHKATARAAAVQALLVTGAGALAMLGGFVMLGQAAGTYELSAIVADPPTGGAVAVALVLILAGAFTKSAQFPFHFWLPGAMAAPTPVSAYLHSATMVKAGVYLIARLAPPFAAAVALWRPLVLGVGVVTMLVGGYEALRRHDLKSLLAYGTVSQLGFLVVLVGSGVPALTFAGVAVLVAHALFKATLFLVTGIVDHQAHTRDIRRLTGLGRVMPVLAGVAAVAAASMAGVPPLLGFVAKEAAIGALLEGSGPGAWVVAAGVVLGSMLTVAYSARFLWGAFGDKPAGPAAGGGTSGPAGDLHGPVGSLVPIDPASVVRPPMAIVAPAAVLAALTVVLGLAPALMDPLVAAGAAALGAGETGSHLQLWHGLTLALGVSVLVLVVGAGLFRGRSVVEGLQTRRWLPAATDVYRETVRLLNVGADRLTGIVQNGSLPVYLGVILTCFVALPAAHLLVGPTPVPDLQLAESPLHAVVTACVAAAAVATAVLTRRFAAVLALGTVGFGVAVLFVIQGAPDLALTQLLIETLAVVIFLLVLRHLPERFDPVGWALGQGLRLVLSVAVGGFVAVLAAIAAASRTAPAISADMTARSLPDAGGRNVVNVILVDFRGFDTLGEITVLAVAALGIASLVMAGRRSPGPGSDAGTSPDDPTAAEGEPGWDAEGTEVRA